MPTSATLYCLRCLTTFEPDPPQCPNLGCAAERPKKGWGRMCAPGEIFDRTYRIERVLALGGAGVTYLGREIDDDGQELGPRLAIKVLFAHRDSGTYLRRLATEAQILQELDHPHIVQYLGFAHRAGHSPYLVTKFESGGSLLDHLQRHGPLPIRRAARIGQQVCAALQKAHERDIIHRDLKPENVLLEREVGPDEDPTVRVADFGIAKITGSLNSNLTRVGTFVGTPHYAAPEQFIGEPATPATDIYALGAMLLFSLTLHHLVKFADRLDPADTYQLLDEKLPPKLEPREGDDPADVLRIQQVLSVAMAFQPDRRCSARELHELLGQVAAGRDVVLPPGPTSSQGVDPYEAPPSENKPTNSVTERAAPTLDAPPVEPVLNRGPAANGPTPGAAPSSAPVRDGPSPTVDEAPGRTVDSTPASRRHRSLLFVATLFGLLMVGGALAGLALWRGPELLAQLEGGDSPDDQPVEQAQLPLPIELTGRENDPAMRADFRAVRRSLQALVPQLASACHVPRGPIHVQVVVEPTGAVRSVEMLVDQVDSTDRCIQTHIEQARLARSGDRPVRIRVPLRF